MNDRKVGSGDHRISEEQALLDKVLRAHGQAVDIDLHGLFREMRKSDSVYAGDILADYGVESLLPAQYRHEVYSVFGYHDVQMVLRNIGGEFTSELYADSTDKVWGRTVLSMDPPTHRAHRLVLHPVFSREAMDRWRETVVRPVVEHHVDSMLALGRCDLNERLLQHFPITVFYTMLDVPKEETERFHSLAMRMMMTNDLNTSLPAADEIGEDLERILNQRRHQLKEGSAGEDVITQLLGSNEASGSPMSTDDLVAFLRLMLPAGSETTTRGAGNMLVGLLSAPGQWEALRADQTAIPGAVLEALRWDGPVAVMHRATRKDVQIGGKHIPAGSGIELALASANRDEAQFSEPDRFDFSRAPTNHLGLGHGAHICIGQYLAKNEMAVVLQTLFNRMPRLRLDEDQPAPRIGGVMLRAPDHLYVRWD